MFFTKYTLFAEKKCSYMEKKFYIEKFFTKKTFFYREKYIGKSKKYMSHLRNIFYAENVCVTNKI